VAQSGEEYPVIRADPSLLVRLDAAVTALLTNLNRSSESLNALLDEGNREALRDTLANLTTLSKTLARRSGAIDSSLADGAKAMENAARLTAELPALVERLRRSADAFDRMAEEGTRVGASVSSTLEVVRTETRQVAAEARKWSAETLPEARALIGELRELTATLRRIGDQVERNPAVLIRGRSASKPGPGE
jgi:phospholipid/cholesterol/gamma-HCH transport system substrate-binding protein